MFCQKSVNSKIELMKTKSILPYKNILLKKNTFGTAQKLWQCFLSRENYSGSFTAFRPHFNEALGQKFCSILTSTWMYQNKSLRPDVEVFFLIDPRANEYISYKAGQGFPLSGS